MWYKIWPQSGYNPTHIKHKLLRKRRRAYKSSWSRRANPKSFVLTIPLNLANIVKTFPGIIARQHLTDRKQMGSLREQCAESRKGHLRYCCNQVLDEKCWADSMECYTFLRNIQDLLSDGKTPLERRFGVPFNGRVIPCGAMVEYINLFLLKTYRDCINSVQKSCQVCSLDMRCTREETGKETSWSQTLRNWNRWTHLKSVQKDLLQRKC